MKQSLLAGIGTPYGLTATPTPGKGVYPLLACTLPRAGAHAVARHQGRKAASAGPCSVRLRGFVRLHYWRRNTTALHVLPAVFCGGDSDAQDLVMYRCCIRNCASRESSFRAGSLTKA
jgi:hypothetical protein